MERQHVRNARCLRPPSVLWSASAERAEFAENGGRTEISCISYMLSFHLPSSGFSIPHFKRITNARCVNVRRQALADQPPVAPYAGHQPAPCTVLRRETRENYSVSPIFPFEVRRNERS